MKRAKGMTVARGSTGFVVVQRGSLRPWTLSRENALRLWVLLGAATMPETERLGMPSPEWVDAAVAMILDPSPVGFDANTASAANTASEASVAEITELADLRGAIDYVGASTKREAFVRGIWIKRVSPDATDATKGFSSGPGEGAVSLATTVTAATEKE